MFSRFATKLDDDTKRIINRGKKVREVLKQGRYETIPTEEQIAIFLAVTHGVFDDIEDSEFDEAEKQRIITICRKEFELDDSLVETLLELTDRELQDRIDLWQFTNLINEAYSPDEKQRLLENIWRIIYADGKIDKYEDWFVRKLTKLLRISHHDFIAAKLKARE